MFSLYTTQDSTGRNWFKRNGSVLQYTIHVLVEYNCLTNVVDVPYLTTFECTKSPL